MNDKLTEIQEADLHAYVDKQLAEDKLQAVEAFIKENPEIAKKVAQWQQQNEAINAFFTKDDFTTIPEKLTLDHLKTSQSAQRTSTNNTQNRPWYYSLAASLLLMTISAMAGWTAKSLSHASRTNGVNFVNSAISAYQVFSVEKQHPVEISADKQNHLVAWLSKRIGHPLQLPDLQKFNYKLLGGRLLSMQKGRPAAQFMFENKQGKRLTLLVSKNPSYHDLGFNMKKDNKINTFYWMDSNVAYSITGEINIDKLRQLSKVVYQQLKQKQGKQVAAL